MPSIKKHLSGYDAYEKRRRKADIEASVSKHPNISSFFSTASLLWSLQTSFRPSPSAAADNAVTVVTHHVCDVSSARDNLYSMLSLAQP